MRNVLFAVALAFYMVIVAGCQPPGPEAPSSQADKQPSPFSADYPDHVLPRLDGSGGVDLHALRGKPLLLYFLAPWTDSADASIREVQRLDEAGIRILPVVVDRRPLQDREMRMPVMLSGLPPVAAHDGLFRQIGGIRALPSAVLLNELGDPVNVWTGFTPADRILAEWSRSGEETPRPPP